MKKYTVSSFRYYLVTCWVRNQIYEQLVKSVHNRQWMNKLFKDAIDSHLLLAEVTIEHISKSDVTNYAGKSSLNGKEFIDSYKAVMCLINYKN